VRSALTPASRTRDVDRVRGSEFRQPASGLLADDIARRNIMSKTLALAAALVAVLAGSAFAGDQDLVTLLRDSGRYVPDANLPDWNSRNVPAGAYASERAPRVTTHAFASAVRPAFAAPVAPQNDFQLQGR
jgi:hypothetical protein